MASEGLEKMFIAKWNELTLPITVHPALTVYRLNGSSTTAAYPISQFYIWIAVASHETYHTQSLQPAGCDWEGKGNPDSNVHEANMGPIWGRQDPGGPHVGPRNFATWD